MTGIRIHDIGGYVVRNYLLETPEGIIAVDTGYPGGFARFRQRFEKRWPLSALRYVFLTHHHDDHAGFLADLLAHTDARLILHEAAVPLLAGGHTVEPPGSGYSSRVASLFSLTKKDFTYPPVMVGPDAVRIAQESDQFFLAEGLPLQILLLPGHTADSIGLYLPQSGDLLCGDAAMNAVISIARHTIWIDDAQMFGRSWDRMLALGPRRIVPSHGNPFPPGDLVRYRHYLQGRTLIRP